MVTCCSMQHIDLEYNIIQITNMDWVYALGPTTSDQCPCPIFAMHNDLGL